MTKQQIDQLRPLALDHRLLRTLIALWDFDVNARADWPLIAIIALSIEHI